MANRYSLAALLEHPDVPLTDEQFANWDKYMAMTNDDVSAADVDIGDAVGARISEIEEKGTFW
ncbi:MAG: hypothetical protein LBU70_00985 [Chitinispirillales bacterium]|jgi:hypothetical protein|nr:hypothetical protein [Chitinispirillales bacterium]